jgi:hypothetical protein
VNNEKLEVEKRDLSEMRVRLMDEVDESFNESKVCGATKGGRVKDSRGCKFSRENLENLAPAR